MQFYSKSQLKKNILGVYTRKQSFYMADTLLAYKIKTENLQKNMNKAYKKQQYMFFKRSNVSGSCSDKDADPDPTPALGPRLYDRDLDPILWLYVQEPQDALRQGESMFNT